MKRPTIGMGMICNVADERLDAALASFRPHVDKLVLVDTSLGGEESEKLQAMCAEHDVLCYPLKNRSILAEDGVLLHFAEARNETFQYLEDCDWYFWGDSDDVLEGGENLRQAVRMAGEEIQGFWFPYLYTTDEYGNPTTRHSRERLVRMDVGWRWQGRLHETLVPTYPVHWIKSEDVEFVHTAGYADKTPRNLRLLNMMYDEEPGNIRTWLYFGYQYFANQEWSKSVEWFRTFYRDAAGLPLERWGAMVYEAVSLRNMGQFDEALKIDNAAVFFMPQYATAYFGLAESYLALGAPEKAIHWAQTGLTKAPPDDLLFVNSLDYTFRPYQILHIAHGSLGQLKLAIDACDSALEVRPQQKELVEARELYLQALARKQQVDAYLHLAGDLSDSDRIRVAHSSRNGFRKEPDVLNMTVPAQLRLTRRGTQPEIAIFCGATASRWAAPSPDKEGIGGSETAVVEIAKRLNRDGWRVLVYNTCEELEGWYDGVGYLDWRRWRREDSPEVLVVWRNPLFANERSQAREMWLWAHDLHYGEKASSAHWERFAKVFGVSKWHAEYLQKVYPALTGRVEHLYNGINLERFQDPIEKQRWRCVYTSSPDRGLVNLLTLWPAIRQVEPEAELHVFYGWENIDRMIAGGDVGMMNFKQAVLSHLDQPGVFNRGRLPQDELAKELLSSDLWLYPTSFLEVFCINAVEAMAAGLYPVTSQAGALPEVIGNAAPLVPGRAGSYSYNKQWLGMAIAFLQHVSSREQYEGLGIERAQQWSWQNAYEECWVPNLKALVTA